MKKLQLPSDIRRKEAIKAYKDSVSNNHSSFGGTIHKPFFNTPDEIFFMDTYSYFDHEALPFVYLTFNNENQIFFGGRGEMHYKIYSKIHWYLFSKGYKMSDITGDVNHDKIYNNMEFQYKGEYIRNEAGNPKIVINGRCYFINIPDLNNKRCVIFTFWEMDRIPMDKINDIVYEISKKKRLFDREIYIANGTKPLIHYNEFTPGDEIPEIEDNSEEHMLHMMNAKDKHDATSNYRQTRDEMMGKKLGNMTQAEWNNMKYGYVAEGKKVYITEEQMKYIQEQQLLQEGSRDNQLLPYLEILNSRGIECKLGELKNFLMKKFVTEANIHALSMSSNFYLVGVARYYFNGDLTVNKELNIFNQQVTDSFIPEVCSRLDEIIVYLRNAYIDNRGLKFEQPEDFGELSIAKLFRKYGGIIDREKAKYAALDNSQQETEKRPNNGSVGNEYTFNIMYSYEDCKQYNQATSPGAWCITYGQQHYNAYTKRNGAHFVIFAKNGYENIPRKVGKSFPLDEYGLSLIAVRQSNKDGSFIGATTRWNHGGYGGAPTVNNADYALDLEQLKQITGLNDEEWQNIFSIYQENGTREKTNNRLLKQREKIDIVRKFKYVEMLLRNGATWEQLKADNRISNAKLLYPANIRPAEAKINKSIIGISITDNDQTYWSILDNGSIKVDELLCDEIQHGETKGGWFGWETKHANEFAICTKGKDTYLYMYRLHSLLNLDGNKKWTGVEDLTENLVRFDVAVTSRYQAHHPFSVLDIETLKPISLPNGRVVSEEAGFDDIPNKYNIDIIYFIGDSAAREYYYYDIASRQFIKELNGFLLKYIFKNTGLFSVSNPIEENIMGKKIEYSEYQNYFQELYDTNKREFISIDGHNKFCNINPLNDRFGMGHELDRFGMGHEGENTKLFVMNSIELGVPVSEGVKKQIIYNYATNQVLTYPDGKPIYFDSHDFKSGYNLLVLQPNKGDYSTYCWANSIIYNTQENKFYVNEDGGLTFYYYGKNLIKDKYGKLRELPASTDGPYWYQTQEINFEQVQEALDKGMKPNEVFDHIYMNSDGYENYDIVELNGLYNIYDKNTNRLLLENWCVHLAPFHCKLAALSEGLNSDYMTKDNTSNYARIDGGYLLDESIYLTMSFNDTTKRGIIKEQSYSPYNIIDNTGKKMHHIGVEKIETEPDEENLCYKVKLFSEQGTKYMSIYGNVFKTPEEARKDSLIKDNTSDAEKHEYNYNNLSNGNLVAESKNYDAAARTHFKISTETLDDYAHVVDDVIEETDCSIFSEQSNRILTREGIDELCSATELSDVMSSFDVQSGLNPKFWDEEKQLNPRARMKLLDIADSFFNSLEVGWVKPIDVIMTGSLCNYNWSKFSDVDLHIVLDFNDVDERTNFVKDYFDAKKKIWNNEHEDLKIYGYPVELYVQDENEEHTASGIYSLYRDEWITEPERDNFTAVKLNKDMIAHKVQVCAEKIEDLENEYANETDVQHVETISKKVKKLFDKIKGIRKESLAKLGEMAPGNIWFKALKRCGYLKKLIQLKAKTFDTINSIK